MNYWGYWLNESIYTDEGVFNICKRKHALYQFCQEGLIPFIESAGYRFRFAEGQLYRVLLRMMYTLHEGKSIRPLAYDCDHYNAQYDHFHYKITSEDWQAFWGTWGSLEDFAENKYAHHLQFELAEFVWSWMDMNVSPSAIQLYKEIEEAEYHEELTKGKDDPYLQETSRREYQDRHWH